VGRRALVAAALVIAGSCTVLSARAAAVWHDDLSLWTEATRVVPESPRAWAGLSHATRLAGRVDEAIELSQRALAIDPTFAPAHLTYGYNLLRAGRRDDALPEMDYVQEHAPDLPGLAHGVECASRPALEAAACIDAH
jgi:tetratricopeptide (TPR) repeat protein